LDGKILKKEKRMKKGKLRGLILGIVILTMVVPSICFAIGREVDPRDSFPAPPGTDAFLLYYRVFGANHVNANGQYSRAVDLNGTLAIARWAKWWGISEKYVTAVSIMQPYGYQNESKVYGQTSTGLGDTIWIWANYFP